MYSIQTERYDQGRLNKPSYMFLPSLAHEVSPEQSKCSKHLTGFLRYCMSMESYHHYCVLTVFKVMLIRKVAGMLQQVGKCIYLIVDDTGPPIQVHRWYHS
jgi:hypothetical protein